MRVPEVRSTRTFTLPPLDQREAEALQSRLLGLAGVHEVLIVAAESTAYLKVDSRGFDEHNVLNTIAENGEHEWPRSIR
jgi:hypothetical protein